AAEPPVERVLRADPADIDGALLEDAVLREQHLDRLEHWRELVAPSEDIVRETGRHVLVDAARPEIGGMEPSAAYALVEFHQLLALLESPQERRERADIEAKGADVEKVVEDAGDLSIKHADVFCARRHLDAEQRLDSERIAVLHAHRRDIVEPVEIRHRLQERLVLDQLFGTAMEQTDMRIGALHHLTVHLEDEAQYPVGRRVLRPKIHGEALDPGFRIGDGGHFPASFTSAFSSPGSTWFMPSQGETKSKLRNSCFRRTGS